MGWSIMLLGTAQDAGYPSAGCVKQCCTRARRKPALACHPVSLAIFSPAGEYWLIDCTPDFPAQCATAELRALELAAQASDEQRGRLRGIFLTHAHIGHYCGLINLGREVMNTRALPLYCMPRMSAFITANAPWELLVSLGNISLRELSDDAAVELNDAAPAGASTLSVTPFLVPHRGEYSETVGYAIAGPARRVIYIPDIDAWDGLQPAIEQLIAGADIAYLDATFFSGAELPGRDMREIPHPTVESSLQRFAESPAAERNKIRFLHFNHSNPLLDPDSAERRLVESAGCHVARQWEVFEL